jgi:hypothetical protein
MSPDAVLSRQVSRARLVSAGAGLFMGAAWAWNAGTPLWEHSVKLLVLMLAVSAVLSVRRWRLARRDGRARPAVSIPRLITAKVLIVFAASIASYLLGTVTARPDYVVAACLTVCVTLSGPRLRGWLLERGELPQRGKESA